MNLLRRDLMCNCYEDVDISDLLQFIEKALNNVGEMYYSIMTATHNGQKQIFRERVFCYELYHQMRCLQITNPSFFSINIDPEIDKRGHEIIDENINPDFIIHERGTMKKNCAVIEVKVSLDNDDIVDDFQKLCCMINNYNYIIGVFILINNNYCKFVEKAREKLKNICFQVAKNKIYVLCKESKKSNLIRKKLSDIII